MSNPDRLLIRIALPNDRDFTGALRLLDERGACLAGPYEVCGRCADQVASEHGNPTRATTLPFGDPPFGVYRVDAFIPTGGNSMHPADFFGNGGAFVLRPLDGDAAEAARHGRDRVLIHAGPPSPDGLLCATAGDFRLTDADLLALKSAVGEATGVLCECISTVVSSEGTVVEDGLSIDLWDFDSYSAMSGTPPYVAEPFFDERPPSSEPPFVPVEQVEAAAPAESSGEILLEDPEPPSSDETVSGTANAYDE